MRQSVINGQAAARVKLWSSGTTQIWVWDRMIYDLTQGDNLISINTGGRIMMDHVNVLYAGQN